MPDLRSPSLRPRAAESTHWPIGLAYAIAALLVFVTPVRGSPCASDCNEDGIVSIAEVVTAVNVALDLAALDLCPAADPDGNGRVTVAELVRGVKSALEGCPGTPTPSPEPTPTATPGEEAPPIGGAALLPWLEAGRYLLWRAESAVHPSGGPHFGRVRTFVNEQLYQSLQGGNASHPAGAAAVKELYGSIGDEVRGWSVSVKIQDDSSGGAGWYWYERFGSNVYGDAVGAPGCTGCHGSNYQGFTSKDFVLAPFPLQ